VFASGSRRRLARRLHRLRLGLPLVLVGLSGCSGCSGCGSQPHVVPLTPAEQALTRIAMAYNDAHSQLGRGPKNADELKPFLKEFGDPDQLLVSPNDGQPFVVVWGANPTGGPTDYHSMFPILAYERKGASGKRAVTDVRGRPMTVPEEDFPKLTFVGRHKPPAD
jgi:hypothetical protein